MRFDTSVTKASELTAANLRNVAKTLSVQQLSRLTLPEIEAVVQAVSKVIPAGNVPGMILSGLARLPGRRIPMQKMKQDVTALFSGLDHVMDQAVYGAFFAGPAAVLWGYQNLLKLAGKDPESAFPEGTWQFYADYALREDTARHVNETHGFDSILKDHNLNLSKTDRLTAWFMASVTCLHQYNALLQNEWRERVAISLLEKHLRQENETQHEDKAQGRAAVPAAGLRHRPTHQQGQQYQGVGQRYVPESMHLLAPTLVSSARIPPNNGDPPTSGHGAQPGEFFAGARGRDRQSPGWESASLIAVCTSVSFGARCLR